jgi:hypothetical protein
MTEMTRHDKTTNLNLSWDISPSHINQQTGRNLRTGNMSTHPSHPEVWNANSFASKSMAIKTRPGTSQSIDCRGLEGEGD